jgi:hypothetical protein
VSATGIDGLKAVPLKFMLSNGLLTNDPVAGAPIVDVDFYFDPQFGQHEPPSFIPAGRTPTVALIDTGADQNYVDPLLIRKHSCPETQKLTAHGATSSIPSAMHAANLFFRQNGHAFQMGFIGVPLLANGRPYPIVLGRRFLQLYALTFNIAEGIFRLQPTSNPKAV